MAQENVPLSDIMRAWSEIFMRHHMREFKQFIDEADLTFSQASTLSRLYFGSTCGNSEIADHLGVSDSAASQLVDRLVQRGLLARSEHADDRRVVQLALTEAGRLLMEQSAGRRFRWVEQLADALPVEQQAQIAAAFNLLIDAADRLDRAALASEPSAPSKTV